MGRKKDGKKRKGVEMYDSDDERAYANEKIPDPQSAEYYNDEVDEFHANRDKIALKKENVNLLPSGWSSDEEVLGFSDEDSDNEEALVAELKRQKDCQLAKDDMASDIEPTDDEDDESQLQSWGRLKSRMYGTDVHKKKIDDYSDSDINDYDLEEQSALAIQRRQAQLIDEQEFELQFAQLAKAVQSGKAEQTTGSDLSKLSNKEKWQIVKKESPELQPLIDKYQATLKNVRESLLPLMECINRRQLDASVGFTEFLKEKIHLSLDFCINVSFYFVLKVARETNIQNHPIIKRLVQFQGLMKRLDTVVGSRFESDMDKLLTKMKKRELSSPAESQPATILSAETVIHSRLKRKLEVESPVKEKRLKSKTEARSVENHEESSVEDEDELDAANEDEQDEDYNENDLPEDSRRSVTDKILKNRGLTPRRKKEYKNPRVKHRMKYRKAKIRRRGQIREVRREVNPYSGEISGIRAGVKRGIKLKT